jgi:hypothetical protein
MDIDDEFEPLTVYSVKLSPAMLALVRSVLERMPDSYSDDFPSFSIFESHSDWHAHVEREDSEDVAIVVCDPRLLNEPRKVALGTIAHEFAHLFLGHIAPSGLENEYQADDLARRWGFKKEIGAMRALYGPPTESSRRP